MKYAIQFFQVVLANFKNVVIGILLLLMAGFGYRLYRDSQTEAAMHADLLGQQEQYRQLNASNAQLESDYVSAAKLHKLAEQEWSKEKKDLQGQIVALSSATFSVAAFSHEQAAPDVVAKDFLKQEVQYQTDAGAIGPPIGYVQIFNKDGRTISGLYAHNIRIDAVVTKDEKTGRFHVLARAFYTLTDEHSIAKDYGTKPNWTNVPFPLHITGGEFFIDPTSVPVSYNKPKFRWAPHVNLGAFGGLSQLGLEAGFHGDVSFYGYGQTRNDLDWKILGVGVNGSRGYVDANVTPLQWRIGNVIPLVSDVYIGPGVGFGTHGVNYFLGLTTTL
jgi:hypothetical protein